MNNNHNTDECDALQRLLDDVRYVRNADDVAFGWQEATELAALKAQQAEPFELRLCEQYTTVLQPGRTYLFTVDQNCPKCVAIAKGERVQLYPKEPRP